MAIKLLAMDFDGVIPVEESPLYLFEKLGRRKESDALANEFYSGLANAKSEGERDAVPGMVWQKTFSLLSEYPTGKMKNLLKDLEFVSGAKQLFNYCQSNGIRTSILSATVRPIVAWNLQVHKLRPDALLASECTINEGRFERLVGVLSPLGKKKGLEALLRKYRLKRSECLVVGDAFSEIPMFSLVGKENSVAFNYRQDLSAYCAHMLYRQGDAARDLRKIIGVIEEKAQMKELK